MLEDCDDGDLVEIGKPVEDKSSLNDGDDKTECQFRPRRKASQEAQRVIYNCLKDNC